MVRFEETDKARLQAMADKIRSTPASLAFQATMALVDAFEAHGRISHPLRFSSESVQQMPELMLNEPASEIGHSLGRALGEDPAIPRLPPLPKSGGEKSRGSYLSDTEPGKDRGACSA